MKLKLAMMFQNGCILQREKPCTIWGEAIPYSEVTVELQGQTQSTQADEQGKWSVVLEGLAASKEEVLSVRALQSKNAEESISLQVSVGEVWILGGQSNMEFQMRYDHDIEAELKNLVRDACPDIRFFAYPQVTYEGQMEDYDYPMSGKWLMLTKENLEYFGAVGYYFAKHIAQIEEISEVPIGLLACNWGGTPACAWMDEENVMKHGRVWREEYEQSVRNLGVGLEGDYLIHREWSSQSADTVQQVLDARKKYEQTYRSSDSANRGNPFKDDAIMYPTTWEQQLEMMKNAPAVDPYLQQVCDTLGPFHPYRPSGLYHTMLEKVAPYTARGVLWYQGESDSCHADIYEEVFSDMIENWRQLWKDELPFFCVQIAPFDRWLDCRGIGYPQVRLAQQRTADHMDGVYLACIADVGDETDIHPKRKRPVGERLALLAEKYIYGKNVEADAPRCNGVEECSCDLKEGKEDSLCGTAGNAKAEKSGSRKFALLFSHAQGGLVVHGNQIALDDVGKEFRIYHEEIGQQLDKEAYQITIDNDRILVTLKDAGERKETYRIAYCMTDYYEGNLFNQAGLPVFPFEVVL